MSGAAPSRCAERELHASLRPVRHRIAGTDPAIVCLVWGDDADPTAVLVHGNGGHARWWDPIVPHLVPGWRLVVPHLRGHGESAWAEPPRYRLADFAADLDVVIDALAAGAVPLVGHSMGGRVALWLAAKRPQRVAALAVLDSRLAPIDPAFAARHRSSVAGRREGRGYPSREAAMAAFRFLPDEPEADARVAAHIAYHAVRERGPGDWTYRFDRAVLSLDGDGAGDLRRCLPQLRCPVWVAAGAESRVMRPSDVEALRAAVPQATAAILPGAHHLLVSHPDAVGPPLRAFLDGAARALPAAR